MSQMNLPAYRFPTRNALLDLSGINNAIDGYQNAERYAEAETYKRGQDQQNMLMRKAALADSRAARQFSQDMQTRNFERQQADSDRNYALRERQVSAAEAARQSQKDQEKRQRRIMLAGSLIDQIGNTKDPLERQKRVEMLLESDADLAGMVPENFRGDPGATLGYVSALARAHGYKPRVAQASGETPETRAQYAVNYGLEPGSDAYRSYVLTGKLPTKLATAKPEADQAANISSGLQQLYGVTQDYTDDQIERSIGTLQGDDEGGMLTGLSRLWGSLTFDNVSPTEVRRRIAGDTEALAAAIKPLIRKPGEGPWTDADQRRLVAVVGDLALANDKPQYLRQLEQIRQRVKANFGIDLPPIAGASQSGNGPTPGSVEDGYVFQGGDPADPNNWRRQ